jgi:Polysaccharide biosynthesis/export protein
VVQNLLTKLGVSGSGARHKGVQISAFVFLLCTGCGGTKTAQHPELVPKTPSFLTSGDVVKVTFPGAPELNQTQKISTDGTLSLPLVGEVHAAGKTPGQLQSELAALYKPQLQDNEVLVTVESRALPEADLKKVSVIRIVKGEHQAQIFDLRPVLRGLPTPAIYVSSGDVIYVPERLLNF